MSWCAVNQRAHDPVVDMAGFERRAAAGIDDAEATLLHQRQHTQDLARTELIATLLDQLAHATDVLAHAAGAIEQPPAPRWLSAP